MIPPKRKSPKTPFQANKKMTQAAIAKGKAIGLGQTELFEMVSLMDKSLTKEEINSLISSTKKQTDFF